MDFSFLLVVKSILSSYSFMLTISSFSFILKLIIIYIFFFSVTKKVASKKRKLYLSGALIGAVYEDISWVILLSSKIFLGSTLQPFLYISHFVARLGWIFYILQYQSLALF